MDLQDLQDDRRSDLQFGEKSLINSVNPKLKYKQLTRHKSIYQRIEIILYILFIHVHSFCSRTCATGRNSWGLMFYSSCVNACLAMIQIAS